MYKFPTHVSDPYILFSTAKRRFYGDKKKFIASEQFFFTVKVGSVKLAHQPDSPSARQGVASIKGSVLEVLVMARWKNGATKGMPNAALDSSDDEEE